MVNKEGAFFKLYACCIPVKGFARSIITDLQRGEVFFITNEFYEVLQAGFDQSIYQICNSFKTTLEPGAINDYFNALVDNDLGFFCDKKESEHFPALQLTWDSPLTITNVIIDIDKKENVTSLINHKINKQLETLGCMGLQLRVFEIIEWDAIKELLTYFTDSRLRHIDLVIPEKALSKQQYLEIFELNGRLKLLTIHSCDNDMIDEKPGGNTIVFTTKTINSQTHCGNFRPNDFYINMQVFTESLHFNSCLNRKISIDTDGNIKNCPSLKKSYGHISEILLSDALNTVGFKNLWSITKDQVKVCSDCEFRRICVDCRAYVENPEDDHSKPLKCGYNPYTNNWEEWRSDPSKQHGMKYYNIN